VVLRMPTPDGHTCDHQLLPGHAPLHFDGGLAPGCHLIAGPTQDLNLMARGGAACMLAVQADTPWQSDHAMTGLYTADPGVWTDGLQSLRLPAHTLLWLEQTPAHAMRFAAEAAELPRAYWLGYTPER
jgi:environmental stress-induced protein Ves